MEGIVKESECAAETETTFKWCIQAPVILLHVETSLWSSFSVQRHITAACFGDRV